MSSVFDRLHRPEYTGENRCWPCAITNSLLVTILVGGLLRRGRRTAAVAITILGTGAIALRGYIVPYTPRFAPTLVAALPIDPFGHSESSTATGSLAASIGPGSETADAGAPTGEAVLAELLEAGVVAPDDEAIRLTAAFRDDWRKELQTLRTADLSTLARIANEESPQSTAARPERTWGRSVLVLDSGSGTPVTLRRGVAIAELAAVRALDAYVDDAAIRRQAGRPLRSLLDACPLCDGELTISRSTCCGETTPIGTTPTEKLLCPDCNERFFVFDDPER